MDVRVREATPADAEQMSRILHTILNSWGSDRPYSPAHVLAHYINGPDRLRCSVAVDAGGNVLGFQSLKHAVPENVYNVPEGWGVIGSYVDGNAAGKGVGKALFAASLQAARDAGVSQIDATIGDDNTVGLGYYEAMGFRTWREKPGAICKKFILT